MKLDKKILMAVSLIAMSPLTGMASEDVRWIGTVTDSASSHNTQHAHSLVFTRQDTGERYDIVDSPEIKDLHCKNESDLVVEVEGKRTTDYLLWGNNLKVASFRTLPQVTTSRPHLAWSPSRFENVRMNHRPGYMR